MIQNGLRGFFKKMISILILHIIKPKKKINFHNKYISKIKSKFKKIKSKRKQVLPIKNKTQWILFYFLKSQNK